jgi:hypothetical protein
MAKNIKGTQETNERLYTPTSDYKVSRRQRQNRMAKTSRKHKKRTKEYTLQRVIPPPEIYVSDNVSVASSIGGGLSQCPLPKRSLGQKQTTRIIEDCQDSPTMHEHPALWFQTRTGVDLSIFFEYV